MTWRILEPRLLKEIRKALARVAKGKTAEDRIYDTSDLPFDTGIYIVGIDKRGTVYAISYYDDRPVRQAKKILEQEGFIVTDPDSCISSRESWMINITPE